MVGQQVLIENSKLARVCHIELFYFSLGVLNAAAIIFYTMKVVLEELQVVLLIKIFTICVQLEFSAALQILDAIDI